MALHVGCVSHAFVAADFDTACRGHSRHAREVVRRHGLLEKRERRVCNRAHVLDCLLRVPALVHVGRDERAFADRRADAAGAFDLVRHRGRTDLDLVGDVTFGTQPRGVLRVSLRVT